MRWSHRACEKEHSARQESWLRRKAGLPPRKCPFLATIADPVPFTGEYQEVFTLDDGSQWSCGAYNKYRFNVENPEVVMHEDKAPYADGYIMIVANKRHGVKFIGNKPKAARKTEAQRAGNRHLRLVQ